MVGITGPGMAAGVGIHGTDLTGVGDGTLGMAQIGAGAGTTGAGMAAGAGMSAGVGTTGTAVVSGVLHITDMDMPHITEHTGQV